MLDAFRTNGNSPPKSHRISGVLFCVAREDLSNPANLSSSSAVVDLIPTLEESASPDDAREVRKLLDIELNDRLIVHSDTAQWVSLAERGLL
jgi:hypothetical protein